MAPPDPAAQMVAPQPNVPRETSAPDPLESQLMALLQQKQSNPVQLYQPPMPRSSNERDVGGRGFLSGLVGGFNSRQAHGADDQQQQIKNALLGIESHRRTTLAQQRLVPGQAGRTPTAMRPPMATKEDPYADLKAQKYQAQIDATKALAERRRRVDTTGKRSGTKAPKGKGAPGTKDISSPVSQYYRNIGEQLKSALPGDASYPAKRDAIDAWVAKQIQTAQMNEVARRTNQPKGEAAPSVQDDPAGLF